MRNHAVFKGFLSLHLISGSLQGITEQVVTNEENEGQILNVQFSILN
jgi:hypothetical protein